MAYVRRGAVLILCGAISLLAFAEGARAGSVTPPSQPNSTIIWLGSDFKNNAAAGFGGGIYALNGNLDTSGYLLRGQYVYAGWSYPTGLASPANGNGNLNNGNAAFGYQVVTPSYMASGFVGVDYQQFGSNPYSIADSQLNNKVGAIFVGRVATAGNSVYSAALDGSFSTANNAYWTRATVGSKFGNLTVGPEAIFLGNVIYREDRFGGLASYDVTKKFIVQIEAGYSHGVSSSVGSQSTGSGAYGGFTFVFLR
jgi:hypothetical protein